MVIAIDSELQQHLGERSFSATGKEWQKAEGFFSKGGFQLIACNKIRSVAEVPVVVHKRTSPHVLNGVAA